MACPESARAASCLTERDVRRTRIGAESGDQLGKILVQARERRSVETRKRLRQHARERSRRPPQDPAAGRQDSQLNSASVGAVLRRADQFTLDKRLDEVAGGGLMHVHRASQIVDSDARAGVNDAERPQLGTAHAGLLLDLLKVRLYGIEDQPELAQYAHCGLRAFAPRWTAGAASSLPDVVLRLTMTRSYERCSEASKARPVVASSQSRRHSSTGHGDLNALGVALGFDGRRSIHGPWWRQGTPHIRWCIFAQIAALRARLALETTVSRRATLDARRLQFEANLGNCRRCCRARAARRRRLLWLNESPPPVAPPAAAPPLAASAAARCCACFGARCQVSGRLEPGGAGSNGAARSGGGADRVVRAQDCLVDVPASGLSSPVRSDSGQSRPVARTCRPVAGQSGGRTIHRREAAMAPM